MDASGVTNILDTIGSWVTGFGTIFVDAFTALTTIFWDGTGLTVIGVLALMSLGIAVVKLGIGFVKKLFMR